METIKLNFTKDKSRFDGFHPYCKSCRKAQMKEHWIFKHPKQEHKCIQCSCDISHLNIQSLRCERCKVIHVREVKRLKAREYNLKNPNRALAIARVWRKKNNVKYKKKMKELNDKRKFDKLVNLITS